MNRLLYVLLWMLPTVLLSQPRPRLSEAVVTSDGRVLDYRGSDEDWVEIVNAGDSAANLSGWKIHDRPDFSKATLLAPKILAPGERLLVWATGEAGIPAMRKMSSTAGAHGDKRSWDSAYFVGLRTAGDFDLRVRVYSFQCALPRGFAGLVMCEDTTVWGHSLISGLDGNGDLVHIRRGERWNEYNEIGANYPNTWLRMVRKDSVVSMYIAHVEGSWEHAMTYSQLSDAPVWVGLAVAGHSGHPGSLFYSDLELNGEKVDISQLSYASLASNGVSSDEDYFEQHAEFSLSSNGSEVVYLWNPEGDLVDSMRALPHPVGYSAAKYPDGISTGIAYPATPGQANLGVWPGVTPSPVMDRKPGVYQVLPDVGITAPSSAEIAVAFGENEPTFFGYGSTTVTVSAPSVLRARAKVDTLAPSPWIYGSFLSVPEGSTADVPVISLSTKDTNLTSNVMGIFHTQHVWLGTEIPVWLQIIDGDGELVANHKAGARVQGFSTRKLPQRSIRLHAKGQYGKSTFSWPDFGTKASEANLKRLVLRNGGNDWSLAYMRDALASLIALQSVRCDAAGWYGSGYLFFNARPYGIVNIRERLDERWFAAQYGVSEESISFFRDGPLHVKNGSGGVIRTLQTLASSNAEPAAVLPYIESDNIVDLVLFTTWSGNHDFGINNQLAWMSTELDGKVRWAFHDQDWAFGFVNNYTENLFPTQMRDTAILPARLFRILMQDDSLARAFANRAADLSNTSLHPSATLALLEQAKQRIQPLLPFQKAIYDTLHTWERDVETIEFFLQQRSWYWLRSVAQEVGISEQRSFVAIDGTEGGELGLNSLVRIAVPFEGFYFEDNAIEVRAHPLSGYRFVRWEGSVASTDTVIRVVPGEGLALRAVFEPVSGPRVVVNEIMFRPSPLADTKDFVELYNAESYAVDLSGWVLRDDDDSREVVFSSGVSIPGQGFLVVAQDRAALLSFKPSVEPWLAAAVLPFDLDRKDQVRLWNAEGELVDSVAYDVGAGWPSDADGGGSSLELRGHALDRTDPASWAASDSKAGSPGELNTILVGVADDRVVHRLAVWPVPASGDLTIALPGVSSVVSVDIYSMMGQLMARVPVESASESVLRVGVHLLPPGAYVARVRDMAGVCGCAYFCVQR